MQNLIKNEKLNHTEQANNWFIFSCDIPDFSPSPRNQEGIENL